MDNRLFKKCYIDYKQLERHLYNNIGYESSIYVAYNFIEKLGVEFTNIELKDGFFDFYYKDMLLTISTFNRTKNARLLDTIEIYDSVGLVKILEFNDLEKEVFDYE